MLRSLSRQLLKDRHRLSHQQIDLLLGENEAPKYMQEKIKGLQLVKNYLDLVDFLNEHGIKFLSIKGPLLSQIIYNDASVRFSHDFDILVDREIVTALNKILLENGFEPEYGIVWPESIEKQKMLMELTHHLGYKHTTKSYMVEVHWVLTTDSPVSHKKMGRLIQSNTKEYNFMGRQISSLNEEMLLAYLIIHGTKHGWERLKWLVDVKDFPTEQLSAEKFSMLCKTLNINKAISITATLLSRQFETSLPLLTSGKASQFSVNYCLKAISLPIPRDYISIKEMLIGLRYRLSIFKGVRHKLRVSSSLLVGISDLNNQDSRSKLYYILYRPFSFIKRRLLHDNL